MMQALHILAFCTFSCASSLEIFIDGPVMVMDCRSHLVEESTEQPGERTTMSHTTVEPIDQQAFFYGAHDGDLSFINAAISQMPTNGLDLNWRNNDYPKYAALHIATVEGHPGIVAALLDAGADPNVQDANQWTAVYWAQNKGRTSILELLFEHNADPNLRGKNGYTPLFPASWNGQVEVARLLIQGGACVNCAHPKWELTPLHEAAKNNHPDIATLLLQNGANRNMRDPSGNTAADLARNEGYDAVANLIDNY